MTELQKSFVICLLFVYSCHAKSILMIKDKKVPKAENDADVDVQVIDPNLSIKEAVFDDPDVDIAPPKHLDAVKIARDGHINSNFHKEVFLGEDIANFENGNYELKQQKNRLIKIFETIDANKDKTLDVDELAAWVLQKTREHFKEAKQGNKEKFDKLDGDHDGHLTWNEYLTEFLGQRGFDKGDVANKLANKIKVDVTEELKDDIEDIKDKWLQAAGDNDDWQSLNADEFLDFQHPETSRGMLAFLVRDFLDDVDINGDEIITVHEYMAIPSDVDVDQESDIWAVERREEFRNVIDQDHDGNVTKIELEQFLDPLSESMSEQEARQLISFGDEDGNGLLSLDELLENSEFYTGSKLYNYARSVHEDL
ncbi:unnamed protein product [Clavelina lepadiformis]|uniref:45 kDa calcium-binding protein n=1 Tax=Clavelina lepadiformis TaxID=159417 RepID=A0ABP0GIS4_CLALP